ncbi:hypothetical protein ACEQ8H_006258 [Pleosporales sp. CAS-2024a]
MEKSNACSEHIEAGPASSPAMSDTEKQHHDHAVGAHLELDESSLAPVYFTSKFFVGSMAGIGLGLMAGVGPRHRLGRLLLHSDLGSTLLSLAVLFIGWTEGVAITIVTLAAKDQSALGTASGVAGSIRFLISSVAATVYTVILSNRLVKTIATQVAPALAAAGLPMSSIPSFIAALALGPTAFGLDPCSEFNMQAILISLLSLIPLVTPLPSSRAAASLYRYKEWDPTQQGV